MQKLSDIIRYSVVICLLLSTVRVFSAENDENGDDSQSGDIVAETTYKLVGRCQPGAGTALELTNIILEKDPADEGVYSYRFDSDNTYLGKIVFKIQSYTTGVAGVTYFGAETETALSDEEASVISSSSSGEVNNFTFTKALKSIYTLKFNPEENKIWLETETLQTDPETPVTVYKVIGSYKNADGSNGATLPSDVNMTETPEGSGIYTYVIDFDDENEGTLFFMIEEYMADQPNTYYGVSGGKPFPLTGTMIVAKSESDKEVGSFYFTKEAGVKYTITFTGSTVVLSKEVRDDNNIKIQSGVWDDSKYGRFYPSINSAEGMDGIITSVAVYICDQVDNAQLKRVFSKTFDEDDEKTIEDWNEIFSPDQDMSGEPIDGQTWFYDRNKYDDDNYVYQLVVRTKVDGHPKNYNAYSEPFAINSDGYALVIKSFYLVQLGDNTINEGSNSYVTFKEEENPTVYNVTNSMDSQFGHSGYITFEKSTVGIDEIINYGDEDVYRFTDQVLIRSNKQNVIPTEQFLRYELWRDNESEPMINTNNPDDAQCIHEGRFMAVVDAEIAKHTYKLKYVYKDPDHQDEQVLESNEITFCITVPSPKLTDRFVEFYKGSDETAASDNEPYQYPFSFEGVSGTPYRLQDARYHTLYEKARALKPNVTEKVGAKMLDNKTGTFTYSFDNYIESSQDAAKRTDLYFYKTNGEDSENYWRGIGKAVSPDVLLKKPEKEGEFGGLYDRWSIGIGSTYPKTYVDRFGYAEFTPITITTDCPEDPDAAVVVTESKVEEVAMGQGKIVREDFTVSIKISGRNANTVTYKSDEGEKSAALHFGDGDHDYYYVTIVDTEIQSDKPGQDFELANASFTNTPRYIEGIYTSRQLSEGVKIDFAHNHGNTRDTPVDQVKEHLYSDHLQVRISYLYPFNTALNSHLPNSSSGSVETMMAKIPARILGNVIKSEAAVFPLKAPNTDTSTIGSIDSENNAAVTAGKGYIEIAGGDGRVFGLDGTLVAYGEGHHELAPGIYIVACGSQCLKVAVK